MPTSSRNDAALTFHNVSFGESRDLIAGDQGRDRRRVTNKVTPQVLRRTHGSKITGLGLGRGQRRMAAR